MGGSGVDGLGAWEEHLKHLEQDEYSLIEVSRAVLEEMTVKIALVGLALPLLEANKLVGLQVLQVAHSEELALILQLQSRGGLLLRSDRLKKADLATLFQLVDLILKPAKGEVKADSGLVTAVKLVVNVGIREVPVGAAVPNCDLLGGAKRAQELV